MAKANTYEMEKIGGYIPNEKGCIICGNKPITHRAFYYPTFMNGDAEWLGDYCAEHKNTDLTKVGYPKNEIKLLYSIAE